MDEDKVINKLLEHDDRLDKLVTKADFFEFKNGITKVQDEMLGILRRLDQERIFTNEVIRQMQEELRDQKKVSERHETQIQRIKQQLQIA